MNVAICASTVAVERARSEAMRLYSDTVWSGGRDRAGEEHILTARAPRRIGAVSDKSAEEISLSTT